MGAQTLFATPGDDLLARPVGRLRGQQAVADGHDLVPAPGGVKAALQLAAGAGAERVLQLVAVAPGGDGGDDRLQREPAQLADPGQRLMHLGLLDLQLALVGQHLPGGARVIGHGRDPVGTVLKYLHRPGLGIGPLALADHRANPVPRQRAGHENHVAVEPRDPRPAVGERVNRQLQFVAALGADGACRRRGHASSMAAPWICTPIGNRPRLFTPS